MKGSPVIMCTLALKVKNRKEDMTDSHQIIDQLEEKIDGLEKDNKAYRNLLVFILQGLDKHYNVEVNHTESILGRIRYKLDYILNKQ
mgnify:CR=1 FL=1